MLRLIRSDRGMTLIELMVVCVVMGIALIGLAGIFPLGMANLSQSKMRTVATDLSQQKMEELLKLSKDDTDLAAGTHNDPNNPVRTTFNRYWTVTDNTPVAGMKQITVRVTYPRGHDIRDVEIMTYKSS
jgi:prepilin-type N-terminal cleavage/methylation domain-containing protein